MMRKNKGRSESWKYMYMCSAQSGNLRNLEIALRILRIPRLRRQSRDCVTLVRNLEIA